MWKALSIGSLMLLCVGMASCTGLVRPTPEQRSNCDGWAPIFPTTHDWQVMSAGTVKAILAHDEYGARVCGWKAR